MEPVRGLRCLRLLPNQVVVMWEMDAAADPFRFTMRVMRAEAGAGPFQYVSAAFENSECFRDTALPPPHNVRQLHYALEVTDKDLGAVTTVGPVLAEVEPDLITLEVRSNLNHLFSEFAGVLAWVFPLRTRGPRCNTCYSPRLQVSTQRSCRSCYGTSFAGGFMRAIEFFIQVDPANKRPQHPTGGPINIANTTARCGDWPRIKPGDVIVEGVGQRWRVVKTTQTEHGRALVHQELELQEIPEGDIEHELALGFNETEMKELQLRARRNYTNPYSPADSEELGADLNLNALYPGVFS